SGIGAEVARVCARNGMSVVIGDRAADLGRAVAAEVSGSFVPLDVTDPAGWQAALDTCDGLPGTLYGLVQAAGVYPRYRVDMTDPVEMKRAIEVNQVGVLLGIETVGQRLCAAGGGSIVVIASAAGTTPTQTRNVAYAATKWAARG